MTSDKIANKHTISNRDNFIPVLKNFENNLTKKYYNFILLNVKTGILVLFMSLNIVTDKNQKYQD